MISLPGQLYLLAVRIVHNRPAHSHPIPIPIKCWFIIPAKKFTTNIFPFSNLISSPFGNSRIIVLTNFRICQYSRTNKSTSHLFAKPIRQRRNNASFSINSIVYSGVLANGICEATTTSTNWQFMIAFQPSIPFTCLIGSVKLPECTNFIIKSMCLTIQFYSTSTFTIMIVECALCIVRIHMHQNYCMLWTTLYPSSVAATMTKPNRSNSVRNTCHSSSTQLHCTGELGIIGTPPDRTTLHRTNVQMRNH